jgi:hypothetical protein
MQKLDLNKERAVGFVEAVRTAARNKRPAARRASVAV